MPKSKKLAEIADALEADLRGPHIPAEHRDRVLATAHDIRLEIALREALVPLPPGNPTHQPADARPTVVFFHVDLGEIHPLGALIGETKHVDYRDTLGHAVRSIQRSNPDACVVILTDEKTTLEIDGATIVRVPVDPNRIMYSRMVAERNFAATAVGPLVFLDTDVWLTDKISAAMDGSFDIGLTYRGELAFTLMPVNEGVILASSAQAAKHFFDTCLTLYDRLAEMSVVQSRYPFDIKHWRGGQLSIAAFVGWEVPPESKQVRLIDGLRVRFLSCDTHNYTPAPSDNIHSIGKKWAIHFKGPRKQLMPQFLP